MHRARAAGDGADGSRPTTITLPQARPAAGASAAPTVAALVGRTVADVERTLIIDTLRHTLGNRTHAANILGISIRTLRNKLHGIHGEGAMVPPPPRPSSLGA